MPRDRFLTIMHYLHLVDSSLQNETGEVGYDSLFKVRPLLDHLAAVSPRYYQSMREVSQSHKGQSVSSPNKRLTGKHFSYKAIERGRCCVCSKRRSSRGKRVDKKTKNYCLKCEVYLCLGECFERFHSTLCTLCIFLPL